MTQVGGGPDIAVATGNPGKLHEIRAILADLPVRLRGLSELPPVEFPEEGDDYRANAVAKARAAAGATGLAALADDSGLEVEGLLGAPGPRSARFGGDDLDDAGRVAHLLAAAAGLDGPARRARFVCAAALALPDGRVAVALGECRGSLRREPSGAGGFGYDPVFEPDGAGRTMAELPFDEKNRCSHRARAFRALRAEIARYAKCSYGARSVGS
jgi:XTP/dITP diphosphohydrolase